MFANAGMLGVLPGKRDELLAILIERSTDLENSGCLLYEVGTNDEHADSVFVLELWNSAQEHRESLQLESVRAAIQRAMPLMNGEMGGFQFDVVGSPLRD